MTVLPENIDATYPDRDAGDALHQQHHDVLHAFHNMLAPALAAAELGDVLIFDGTDWDSAPLAAYNTTSFTVAMGAHEEVPAGTRLFWVDDHGNVFMGQNLLAQGDPTPANDSQGLYDFFFSQNLLRLLISQLSLGTVEDPADVTGIRYDAVAGEDAPYAGGDLANLTGLTANTSVTQWRAKPGLVPEGGTTATGGAKAPAVGATISMRTAEMCRVLDDDLQRFALGMDIVSSVCAPGFDILNTAALVRSSGQFEVRNGLRFNNRGQNPTVRTGIDAVSNGTETVTSATANFTQADVGRPFLIGDPINGTTGAIHDASGIYFRIITVTNSTTVVLNQPIAYTATGLTWRMEYGATEIWEHTVGALRTAATFDAADFKINGTSLSTLYAPKSLFVRKSADETVNNSNTFQNDDALALAVAASTVYEVGGLLLFSAAGAADLKARFTGPADMAGTWALMGGDPGVSTTATSVNIVPASLAGPSSAEEQVGGIGIGVQAYALIRGVLRTTTAGTFQLQWAQASVAANDAVVYADSYLTLRPVA